jgi:hypothetical protein
VETLASSCTEECIYDPNCGLAIAAGTDSDGDVHVYGIACLSKLLTTADEHGIRLHGLHELTDEQLAEVFTSGPYVSNEPDWWRQGPAGWYGNTTTGMILLSADKEDESEYLVAATTDENTPDGELVVLSAKLLVHLFANPEERHAHNYVFYGTHALPEAWLANLFPADEIRCPAAA